MDRQSVHQYVILSLFSLLFVAAYSQWALYTSNQNTYFVHGLAQAGLGYLRYDWLANTTDHLPVFSQLVRLSHQSISPTIFYFYHAVLIGLYIFSLSVIIQHTFKIDYQSPAFVFAFTILTFLHSWAIQVLMSRLPVLSKYAKLSDLLTDGVAGQYILGPIFQPSAFGVLLITSIALFLKRRPIWAVVMACLAGLLHPSYLFHALWLTVGYLVLLAREKGWAYVLRLGLLAALLVLPNVLYAWFHFRPTDAETFQLAQQILVEKRIPHHAKFGDWFGIEATIQVLICLLALIVVRRRPRLAPILLLLFLASLSLTLLQLITGSYTLALLFPWRVSILLVPLSTALLVGYLSTQLAKWMETLAPNKRSIIFITNGLLIIVMSSAGLAGTIIKTQRPESYFTLIKWVEEHVKPSDLFLIPPHDDQFRLHAAVPVLIDQKSHPYKDVEVVEWDHRVELANSFYYAKENEEACSALARITQDYPITHIVIDKRTSHQCTLLSQSIEYKDQTYQILKITEHDPKALLP